MERIRRLVRGVLASCCPLLVLASCADPPTVYEVLQTSYPEYRIKDPNRLAARVDSFFGEQIKTPTTVIADLDGNGLDDFAFLLRNVVDTQSVLVAYLQTSPDTYEEFELMRAAYGFDYIEEFRPGLPIEAYSEREREAGGGPVTLSHSAVSGIYYLKSSVVVFWDAEIGSFRRIWTSD